MSKIIFASIQTAVGAAAVALILFFGVMTSTVQAQATATSENLHQKQEQLRALIAQLQETILILQRKQYESVYQKDTNIIHGNSYVEATQRVELYDTPGGKRVVGKVSKKEGGEVTAGPRLIEGVVWWKIDFEEGDHGWVKEQYVKRIPSIVISQDTDGDGIDDKSVRVIGNYNAKRMILFPSSEGVRALSIPEELEMLEKHDRAYRAGQLSDVVDGPVQILQSNPYRSSQPFIKGEDTAVPIAWTALNVTMNSEVEIEVEATRLIDGYVSGGVWSSESLVGDSVGVYYYSIKEEGRIGAGDYRSKVRIKNCVNNTCRIVAESPYRYFSIRNSDN